MSAAAGRHQEQELTARRATEPLGDLYFAEFADKRRLHCTDAEFPVYVRELRPSGPASPGSGTGCLRRGDYFCRLLCGSAGAAAATGTSESLLLYDAVFGLHGRRTTFLMGPAGSGKTFALMSRATSSKQRGQKSKHVFVELKYITEASNPIA